MAAAVFKEAREAKAVVEIVVPVILVEVKLVSVVRPVEERVETVVAKAFKDPVEEIVVPVMASAETPAKVEVPAAPKVPREVKELTVDVPAFKEAKEERPVEDKVVPVILVEVILAKVERLVAESVVRVTLAN